MKLKIRKAVRADLPALLSLMKEFAEFENLGDFVTVTVETLDDAIFGEGAFVECLIAETGDEPGGYAIFYPHFSSFRGQKGYYLEDIYVSESSRGKGIGAELLKEIARLGVKRGFSRIDLQVLEWNTTAIGFYKRLGAAVDTDERHFKFTDDAFARLAAP